MSPEANVLDMRHPIFAEGWRALARDSRVQNVEEILNLHTLLGVIHGMCDTMRDCLAQQNQFWEGLMYLVRVSETM